MKDKQFICRCGKEQGKKVGSWIQYPNPCICSSCKKNNSKEVKFFIMGRVEKQ